MGKYTVGLDFGTLSCRGVLVDAATGAELADSTFEYPHAVMDRELPGGAKLGQDWALQHPQDYLDAYAAVIPAILSKSGVKPEDVAGIGVDFTACTFMPVKRDGTPLCFVPGFENEPHAYVKLWKHHAAQDMANRLNSLARERGETWLPRYGGKISSEWEVPKVMQVISESPKCYEAADCFIEAADWAVMQLCGEMTRNTCTAGYKGIWHKRGGYPSEEFFASLHPGLRHYVKEKLNYPMVALGSRAGGLTEKMAKVTGLLSGTAVAAGNVDAHVTVPAVKIEGTGAMLAIMGTSTCHILMSREEKSAPGMCGVVEDGVYPGLFGYEAGQSCVGDHFAWFVERCVPASYALDAEKKGMNIHRYLREKAQLQKPGAHGLLALDWWNGNRSVLVDADLTGVMLGMTLRTRPEDMYRALIEATAYGTRKIVETLRQSGVEVQAFYASGGISQKDPMTMQIYSDVLNMPVKIAGSMQGPALGSAIFGAVAAGLYPDIVSAAQAMGSLKDESYAPCAENATVYDQLYAQYSVLHDYFGRGANDVMKRLKQISKEQSAVQ